MDCRNMDMIEDNSVDLVVTSPPYYSAKDYGSGKEGGEIGAGVSYKTYLEDMDKVFRECYRVLKDSRFMCINISNILIDTVTIPVPYDYCQLLRNIEGLTYDECAMWTKPEGMLSQNRAGGLIQHPYPRRIHMNRLYEHIFIFRKGNLDLTFTQSDTQMMLDNKMGNVKDCLTDVWYFPCASASREGHPAPFPPELPRRCIKLYTFKGETVLDPFSGSGTTGLACKEEGRNYVGFEISKDFVELSKKKIGWGVGSVFEDEIHEYKVIRR
jgi:site-specific DNA-methyltransferase (adenine-specific)